MGRIKNFLTSPAANAAGFLLAAALLAFSTIGGARAALSYYSENYSTRVQMYDIGVTLQEKASPGATTTPMRQTAPGTNRQGCCWQTCFPKGRS